MTPAEIVSYVQGKTKRTDKNTYLIKGLNWAKDQVCQASLLWKKGTDITLVKGTRDYDLPADFLFADYFTVSYSADYSIDYRLYPGSRESLTGAESAQGIPSKFWIEANTATAPRKIMVGCPTPGQSLILTPYYYYKLADMTGKEAVDSIISALFGDSILICGAEAFVWDSVGQYEKQGKALALFHRELGNAKGMALKQGSPIAQPCRIF